ncbi:MULTISPECIES: YkgJ family cysteine cluster protein [Pseudomonas]|uniref:YkgJ family cysteine cluster protein n=1 Tax=Pseudomonas TaxID=286 RepID=UPI000A05BBD8|nr:MULTISPECIES: YkgJ family cysteine cluster protein [Pseudomonas]MBF3003382.1 YkgJ family cysteine cluster protein [Pseudomonas aeruginosa]MBF3192480.1 YkgJ family cysteine cluster protein [Pseudomonas aeruginosa]MBF3210191.1 YkgJ family cysteine cluster protein [Pseudomonas aeruginosa]NTX89402.1 YkgJ family cysteine cluster protein [Pseudomonas sp. UMA643]NTY19291.1 YkgJ family cysteine cluster protein [Pseudomonas sp. UMC3103]
MSSNVFPCTRCGLCCQNVYLATETRFLDRGDGTCRHYNTSTKGCGIYKERPDICRVDRQYEMHYAQQYKWEEFVTLNLEVCTDLQKREGTWPGE